MVTLKTSFARHILSKYLTVHIYIPINHLWLLCDGIDNHNKQEHYSETIFSLFQAFCCGTLRLLLVVVTYVFVTVFVLLSVDTPDRKAIDRKSLYCRYFYIWLRPWEKVLMAFSVEQRNNVTKIWRYVI
jgi:hypothetical protein